MICLRNFRSTIAYRYQLCREWLEAWREVRQNLAPMRRRLCHLQHKVSTLERDVDELQRSIDRLQAQVNHNAVATTERLTDLQQRLRTVEFMICLNADDAMGLKIGEHGLDLGNDEMEPRRTRSWEN